MIKAKKTVFYKVLFKSWNKPNILRGSRRSFCYNPYLPKGKKPGKWTPRRRTFLCKSGWHVTDAPQVWGGGRPDAKIFLVETRGKTGSPDWNRKIVFSSIRLIKEIKKGTITYKRIIRLGRRRL